MLNVYTGDAHELRVVCEPIDFKVSTPEAISSAFDSLYSVMRIMGGIGIAANQVGGVKRMIVVKVDRVADPIFMVNPVITKADDTQSVFEGCLSVARHRWGKVTRAKRIRVEYYTAYGEKVKLKASGLLAACIQHEIDHLDGKLITDHIKGFFS